jgi:hypothetical protein
MDVDFFEKIYHQQLITEADLEKIKTFEGRRAVSVHWDLRTLLYLGIVLLTTGLGIAIYKNIDAIGHETIITCILFCSIACFFYCFKKSKGYSNKKVESPNIWFDYVLVLGCILMVTFIGYIQFQYDVFGDRWGVATFIPMVLLFAAAYYFDHLGVLSLAITNLAAWVGITVTPLQILNANNFNDEKIIYSGIVLGAGLILFSFATVRRNVKPHFAFTYKNFGIHIFFISALAALFHFDSIYVLVFTALLAAAFFFYKNALKERSFYFLVITFLYGYIGLSCVVLNFLWSSGADMGPVYLGLLYLIISGIGFIRLMIYYNKKLKKNAGIQ